MCVG
jgi:hypothetical protein